MRFGLSFLAWLVIIRMEPKTGFPIFASTSPARTTFLQGLLIAAIVVTGLYVGREVLVPLALAILLSFILTPPLLFLRRLRVPRVVGVATMAATWRRTKSPINAGSRSYWPSAQRYSIVKLRPSM